MSSFTLRESNAIKMSFKSTSILFFSIAIQALILQLSIDCAEIDPKTINGKDKTADLSSLINETLVINNRSPTEKVTSPKDDWTFDMVEYDLMEFLQDLSARYRTSNKTEISDSNAHDSTLDGKTSLIDLSVPKFESEKITTSGPLKSESSHHNNSDRPKATSPPIPNISVANDDHELAESSWQYGIFDRFTRPKASSTTQSPDISLKLEDGQKLDVTDFNHPECGLRTYDDRVHLYPEQFESTDAVKDLSQRRQRLPLSPIAQASNKNEETFVDMDGEKQLMDELKLKHQGATSSQLVSDTNQSGDNGDFNLASRRSWLQQQLGNTLQLLGFNATAHKSMADLFNDTVSELNLSRRENMMKMSSKLGKSAVHGNSPDGRENSFEEKLMARQDELKLEARVIGGTDARLGDSPWSVSLQALVSRPGTTGVEYRHYCGGTIISEHYVLTAAHCLDFMVGRESRLFVVVGDLNWRMSATSVHGRRFGIEKLIIHSGYKSTAFGHDVGLIKTKESMKPLKVNGRYIVNSVCLPDRNVEHTGEAELVGWGLFSNRNEMADSLQIADVPILPRSLCVDLYRRRTGLIQWLIGVELITEKQVCAGTFGRGICQGDSGSALVFNHRNSKRDSRQRNKPRPGSTDETRATIIGTVAFGGIRRCSYQSLPGVYMQTSKYLDWILPRVQE